MLMEQGNMGNTPKKKAGLIEDTKNLWNAGGASRMTVILTGVTLLASAAAIGAASSMFGEIYTSIKQTRYAEAHLEQDAVAFNQLPSEYTNSDRDTGKFRDVFVNYKDADNNGLYESIMVWNARNEDKKAEFPIRKSPAGGYAFPTISDTAVDPIELLDLPNAIYGLPDYKDMNGDGKLESILYRDWDKKQPMILELVDGRYIISNP
jgi:hypothetical protein